MKHRLQTNQCCCCDDCKIPGALCCDCICPSICVTIDPAGSGSDDARSTELDWNSVEQEYSGTLLIAGESVDLRFYFEQQGDYCWFVLESEALGFFNYYYYGENDGPHRWRVGTEILCDDLTASVSTILGELTVGCTTRITPTGCNSCSCLCENLCVTVLMADGTACGGLAHWSEEGQAYSGTLRCTDLANYETNESVTIIIDALEPGADQCYIHAEFKGYLSAPQSTSSCQGKNLTASMDLMYGPVVVGTVTISCADCTLSCGVGNTCCQIPIPLHLLATVIIGCIDCGVGHVILAWNGLSWSGTGMWCGEPISLDLSCGGDPDDPVFRLISETARACFIGQEFGGLTQSAFYCDPLAIEFTQTLNGLECCPTDPDAVQPAATVLISGL